jgi:hypothetical protein
MHRTVANLVRKTFLSLSLLAALAGVLGIPTMAQSTPWIEQAELTASDGTPYAYFGNVAISGSTAVVGAYESGKAYVFTESGETWGQQAELSDGAPGDFFGGSVAVDGSTVVVGAPYHTVGTNGSQGAVYVFVQNGTTWTQQAELTASDGAASDNFGSSVAVSGSIAVVGSPYHQVGSNSAQGAVYVYVQNGTTWSQQAELTASDGASGDQFGQSVSLSGDTAAIVSGGQVYVFVQSGETWTQQAETAGDGYNAVAVGGSAMVAGAYWQGAAYVFAQSGGTWSQQAELTPSNGESNNDFGWSVAIDGGTALAGAVEWNFGNEVGTGPGAAYVFGQNGTTWSQQAELIPPDGVVGDFFGSGVSISGSTAVVGASNHQVGSNKGQGAAYVFTSSGPLYTLADSPSSLSLVQGTQGTSTITITPYNGFSGSVSFSVFGLLNGVTAAFSPNPATSTTTLTLTASETATTGTATVLVNGASGTLTQTTPLTLTVTGVTTVSFSPASLSFSDQAIDAGGVTKMVTLKNTGTVALDIGSIAVTLGTNFAITKNKCKSTLNPGRTCGVDVTFTPTQIGEAKDTLTFTDNAAGNPQSVSLSGSGVAQTALTPSSHTFLDTEIGDSRAYKFKLKNNLGGTLTGISYSTAAPFSVSSSTCGTTLDGKRSCTISVMFSPTSEGTFTGVLTINNSANNSPLTSTLTGTGY